MTWALLKVEELPLGKRVLRNGDQGQDVQELQELLTKTGFYSGPCDGRFGLLTEEAVLFLQQSFNLKTDGRVGSEVINSLRKTLQRRERIIYTVKGDESLEVISQKFAVKKTAWRNFSGSDNLHQKVFPGLKIILPKKAVLIWDAPAFNREQISASGWFNSTYRIGPGGEIIQQQDLQIGRNIYNLFEASEKEWLELLLNHKSRVQFVQNFKKLKGSRFGFDLRQAPINKIRQWVNWFRYIGKNTGIQNSDWIVVPFFTDLKKSEERLYWFYLTKLKRYVNHIMFAPIFKMGTPAEYESSVAGFLNKLKSLNTLEFVDKVFLLVEAGAWNWNLDQHQVTKITFKEAKLIRAQNFRMARYSRDAKLTMLNYQKKQQNYTLIYRDQLGWSALFDIIIKQNLPGVVIGNLKELGKAGSEILASSFLVVPGEEFQDI